MSHVMPSIYRDFNLSQIDASYTLDSFQCLQEERFKAGFDYYLCVIDEDSHEFLFDASQFVEHFIRKGSMITNPQTRAAVSNLQVYVSSKEDPRFRLAMTQEEIIKKPNHLPICWNDPSFKLSERLHGSVTFVL